MKKLKCMDDYINGVFALLINFFGDALNNKEYKRFLNDKKNLMSSTVSLISVAMLGIKENIVEMQQDMSFQSKMFVNSLENVVSVIAVRKDDAYYIDNYKFDNSAELVNTLRNKLAHGNFYIDFDNNRIVLMHEEKEIRVNIDKLRAFVIMAFNNMLQDVKTDKYIRDFCVCEKVYNNRKKQITTTAEIKDVIRNTRYYYFELTTDEGVIPKLCIQEFRDFVEFYSENINYNNRTELLKLYEKMQKLFLKFGCKLNMSNKRISNDDIENKLIEYTKKFMVYNPNLEYLDQIKMMLTEALKNVNVEYKYFESLSNNFKLLILLDAMKKVGSTDEKQVSEYLMKKDYPEITLNYDTYGTILINLFNVVFMYGYDDIYLKSGGYKLNRIDEFDFSLLNLENLKPIKDGIDYEPLIQIRNEYKGIKKRVSDLNRNIKIREGQLNNTKDEDAKRKIHLLINELKDELVKMELQMKPIKNYYFSVESDYNNNFKYFRNKAIVNGIRNSIAHGNYEVVSGEGISNTKIIFSDIYDGRLTFKIELTFQEMINLLQNNLNVIFKFIKEKKSEKKKEMISKFK